MINLTPIKTCFHRSHRNSTPVMKRQLEGGAGFTLVELMVAMLVFSIILTAIMTLFISNTRLARSQMHLSDMQQSHRIAQHNLVRYVRIAGRGGLPTNLYPALPFFAGSLLPTGMAISFDNNVAAGTKIAGDDDALVLEGTDVLTVRGIFNSPVYQINPASGTFSYEPAAQRGKLVINKKSPTGVPQSLKPFDEAINDDQVAESILLVSPLEDSIYAVVEMDLSQSWTTEVGGEIESVTIGFITQGGDNAVEYLALSPGGQYPGALNTVAYAGILEEYQFFVREERAIPGDASSELMPRLARARLFPGTDVAYDTFNVAADQADNILDLQIAFGVDTFPTDGLAIEGDGTDPTPTNTDEWLFNHSADDPTEVKWANVLANPSHLFYLRISTLARTDRPDARFQAPLLTQIEDKDYTSAPFDKYNTDLERLYRRRILQTTVDLRNL